MKNRENRILQILTEQDRVEVSVLSNKLGVSQVTVRKDLDALEERGIISREHGWAVLRSGDDTNSRIAHYYDVKVRMSREAMKLVHDGETIMMGNSSCCAIMADLLLEEKKDITIVTNSAFIASYLRYKHDSKVILLGGIYQNDSQAMVGPLVKQTAENFCVDKLFIGTDGYSTKVGFTNSDHMRAQAMRDMAHQSNKVIMLTESTKFSKNGIVPLRLGKNIDYVITDSGIPEEARLHISNEGTEVIIVPK